MGRLEIDDLTIKRAQRGDQDAISSLLFQLEPLVYNVCLQMLKQPQDAADAAQEAMLKMYLGLPQYKREATLSSWSYRISVNASLDYLRRNKRHKGVIPWEETPQSTLEEQQGNPEKRAMEQDRREELLTALQQIDEGQRAAIILLEYGGFKYREIGKILGISEGTVKSRIYRGREALRNILWKEEN